jgi:signal transduction histidine kinase
LLENFLNFSDSIDLKKILTTLRVGGAAFPFELEKSFRIHTDQDLKLRLPWTFAGCAGLTLMHLVINPAFSDFLTRVSSGGLIALLALYFWFAFIFKPKRAFQSILALGSVVYLAFIVLYLIAMPTTYFISVHAFCFAYPILNVLSIRLRYWPALVVLLITSIMCFLTVINLPGAKIYSVSVVEFALITFVMLVTGISIILHWSIEERSKFLAAKNLEFQKARAEGLVTAVRGLVHDLRKNIDLLDREAGRGDVLQLLKSVDPYFQNILILGQSGEYRKTTIPVLPHLTKALSMFEERYGDAVRVTLRLDAAQLGGCCLTIQPFVLHRIMTNLLSNAVDAMTLGSLTSHEVTVAAERVGHRELRIKVSNPVPKDHVIEVDKIFYPSYSVAKENSFGLGLAIVQKLVLDSGGWIRAKRSKPTEITMELTLPLADSDTPTEIPQGAREVRTDATSDDGFIKVCVIEDNPFILHEWGQTIPSERLVLFSSARLFQQAFLLSSFPLAGTLFVVDDTFAGEEQWNARQLIDLIHSKDPNALILVSSFAPTALLVPHLPEKKAYSLVELARFCVTSKT